MIPVEPGLEAREGGGVDGPLQGGDVELGPLRQEAELGDAAAARRLDGVARDLAVDGVEDALQGRAVVRRPVGDGVEGADGLGRRDGEGGELGVEAAERERDAARAAAERPLEAGEGRVVAREGADVRVPQGVVRQAPPDARVDDVRRRVAAAVRPREDEEPGQEKGDSTSLQRGCSARAGSKERPSRSRAFREMITRPKISRNEWKTAEI